MSLTGGPRTDAVLAVAQRLIGAVHAENADDVQTTLHEIQNTDLEALLVVLAAMVPDDQSPSQLLRWWRDREFQRLIDAGVSTHAAVTLAELDLAA